MKLMTLLASPAQAGGRPQSKEVACIASCGRIDHE
jgi:hypothetical protein